MDADTFTTESMLQDQKYLPLVSIMMPAFNAEEYIQRAIESIVTQSYSNWELIVVNDGSSDRTGEIAESFSDARIRVIHQDNGGESVARNTALQHMNGEYVGFLDADDLFLPEHIRVTVEYLGAHQQFNAVYTDGFHIDQEDRILKSLSSRRRGPFEGWIFEQTVLASDVFGPPTCVLLKRSLISQHDLWFDPEIVIGPDWDFLTRYSEYGRFGYIDQYTVHYRIHTDNVSLRTDLKRRAGYLARCREKAIKLESFSRCSDDTRVAVFYDLLVNLLLGNPVRQSEITRWAEFKALPLCEQGRLYRLMASKAIMDEGDSAYIKVWLQTSKQLNPDDRIGSFLAGFYKISPSLSKAFLNVKKVSQEPEVGKGPLSDLVHGS